MSDKDRFHASRGPNKAVNSVYADVHVEKGFVIETDELNRSDDGRSFEPRHIGCYKRGVIGLKNVRKLFGSGWPWTILLWKSARADFLACWA